MVEKERRITPSKTDAELFRQRNIQKFIEKERRNDEKERLHEVITQKRTWRLVYGACLLMNIIFVICGVIGAYWYE